ncbi:MAG: GAF domain-containing protein [Bacteroidales bacterium]|nr:GAF domain-containing protein [Bacteroidales bacterium]
MISEAQKVARYQRLISQAEGLLEKSPSRESAFATLNAILYHKISYIFWVGFYLLHEKELIVNAYQGPLACQVLPYPRGICWQCIREGLAIIVPDVNLAPDHIACDSRSKSEIVIPLKGKDGIIPGVLDVDSDQTGAFTEADANGLTNLVNLIRL